MPINADAPLTTVTGQPNLVAELSFVSSFTATRYSRVLASANAVADSSIPVEEPDKERDAGDGGPAIPGALVAVIFGVFGLLVIGRRSER